jgi:ferredoxin
VGPSYDNLLELAGACDVPVGFSCRTGVCDTCETALVAGGVQDGTPPLEPPDADHVPVCCAQPSGEVTLDV